MNPLTAVLWLLFVVLEKSVRMGEYWEAVLLGIVQGVAEFLPISSSGHLTIVQGLTQRPTSAAGEVSNLQMTIALHLGTLLSILVVYRVDLFRLIKHPPAWVPIVIATLPIVVVGFTFKDAIEQSFQTPRIAGVCLLGTAALLIFGQRVDQHQQTEVDEKLPSDLQTVEEQLQLISWKSALLIGLFQAFAILPGISRSGSTIAAALIVGLRREHAARFSFLIAIPAISGASILLIKDLFQGGESSTSLAPLALGAGVAFVVGAASLSWLIRLVSQRKLHWFAWYCAVVGCTTVLFHPVGW